MLYIDFVVTSIPEKRLYSGQEIDRSYAGPDSAQRPFRAGPSLSRRCRTPRSKRFSRVARTRPSRMVARSTRTWPARQLLYPALSDKRVLLYAVIRRQTQLLVRRIKSACNQVNHRPVSILPNRRPEPAPTPAPGHVAAPTIYRFLIGVLYLDHPGNGRRK